MRVPRNSNGSPVTLHRRLLLQNLLLVMGLIVAGGVAAWRFSIVNAELILSRNVYAELRTIGDVGINVGIVRGLLTHPNPNRDAIVSHLQYAIGGLEQFIQVGQGYESPEGQAMREAYLPINRSANSARQRLQSVLERFTSGDTRDEDAFSAQARESVDAAVRDLTDVSSSCIGFISERQRTASGDLTRSLMLAAALCLAAISAAVLLSASQYRLVMRPLRRLGEGVSRIAEGQFALTIDTDAMGSSAEFQRIAQEFNRMARELDEFYHRLEEQVRARSRELVRSERLASVGFLAAGVAHEINNPLHIISGYAELTAKQLESACRAPDSPAAGEARKSLRIIREEAFRCKQVTERLLDLSRTGSQGREPLDLAAIAEDVATMTRGLKRYKDRRITLHLDAAGPLDVRANRVEMKQVLLNLTLNALEATPPVRGEVRIEGRRESGWVEVSVADNGRGMSPDVLSRAFEPFFTSRRANGPVGGEDGRGTGLGLSISHVIVENHGGRIRAESEGPGRGARFTIRLPAGPITPQSINRPAPN